METESCCGEFSQDACNEREPFSNSTIQFSHIHDISCSNSVFGGVVAAVCFIYNHSEATRVMWTPPLRNIIALEIVFRCYILVLKTRDRGPFSWLHLLSTVRHLQMIGIWSPSCRYVGFDENDQGDWPINLMSWWPSNTTRSGRASPSRSGSRRCLSSPGMSVLYKLCTVSPKCTKTTIVLS